MNLFIWFLPLFIARVHLNRLFLLIPLFVFVVFTANGNGFNVKQLPGWEKENFTDLWPAWLLSCSVYEKKHTADFTKLCLLAKNVNAQDVTQVRQFFEKNFLAQSITSANKDPVGVITGYFEPLLNGSLSASDQYRYPVYSKPDQEKLQNATRIDIETNPSRYKPHTVLWVDNRYDLFFLQVQGSGRVKLTDGRIMSLAYAANNNHPYTSIGKILINQGLMEREKISIQSLKRWLTEHSDQATKIMQQNQRYIFFSLKKPNNNEPGPRGSLNVPLTPQRSIAIDPNKVNLGSPVWLETSLPQVDGNDQTFNRLVFAQDTGAAIKGSVRADVFFGAGPAAEFLAGHMNQSGKMYLLVPR